MTPALTGGKKPWLIAGVLLITGVSLVCAPENSMVIVLFLPAMISVWAGRSKGILAYAVIAAPALLGVVPVFIGGAVTYAIVMLCGLIMFWMLKKAKPGMSIILPTILVSAITLVILIAESHSKGISLSQNISTMAKSLMDNILSLSSSTLSPGDLTDLNADRAVIEARITKLFPFITIAGTVVPMWINLVIASKIEFKINLTRWSNPE
jgi:hypothetical protein